MMSDSVWASGRIAGLDDFRMAVRLALAEAGGGVCVLDGRMVDAPVLRRAERILISPSIQESPLP